MSTPANANAQKSPAPARKTGILGELVQPFIDLIHAPRALWGINLSVLLEGLVYFGWLTLLAIYFHEAIGLDDIRSDHMVGVLTMGITGSMFLLGGLADKWGVRKAMSIALAILLVGRMILVGGTSLFPTGGGMGSSLFWSSMGGLLFIIVGYGLYQPSNYAGIRQLTDKKTAPMAFAMLYALMNMGGFLPALVSPPIRSRWGIPGVFWTYAALTAVNLIVFLVILTKRVERQALEKARLAREAEKAAAAPAVTDSIAAFDEPRTPPVPAVVAPLRKQTLEARLLHWLTHHPLANPRFAFFIFCLIPVQTLFAHNWLTLPQYVDRAMGAIGHQYMETFVNINPFLIFFFTPIVAALTQKRNVYTMMIIGTAVMAAPTFLLAIAPNVWLLLTYIVIMSIGEAIWQPRFLQYAAEIAPEGQTAAYMGVAQFPWFLTKMVTALYAGWFLVHYCPEPGAGPQNTTTMWFVYGCIAITSTIFLLLGRKWVVKDFKTQAG